jgi:hypothetical protein
MEQVGDRIILEGVLQKFERMNFNGGRIYHAEAYERLIKRLVPDRRMRKILIIYNGN